MDGSVFTECQACLHPRHWCVSSVPKNSSASPSTADFVRACLHATPEYTRRVARISMYYFYKFDDPNDEQSLVIVESELEHLVTVRLLLFATGSKNSDLLGYTEDITFFGDKRLVYPLSQYVNPQAFSGSDGLKCVHLLNQKQALALAEHWKKDSRYTEAPSIGRANYFKNIVDDFKHKTENTWFKLAK